MLLESPCSMFLTSVPHSILEWKTALSVRERHDWMPRLRKLVEAKRFTPELSKEAQARHQWRVSWCSSPLSQIRSIVALLSRFLWVTLSSSGRWLNQGSTHHFQGICLLLCWRCLIPVPHSFVFAALTDKAESLPVRVGNSHKEAACDLNGRNVARH